MNGTTPKRAGGFRAPTSWRESPILVISWNRYILAHEYGEIKVDRIWLIATTNTVELMRLLDPLIPSIDEEIS
jgi:uncharacterized protein with HEPN domain